MASSTSAVQLVHRNPSRLGDVSHDVVHIAGERGYHGHCHGPGQEGRSCDSNRVGQCRRVGPDGPHGELSPGCGPGDGPERVLCLHGRPPKRFELAGGPDRGVRLGLAVLGHNGPRAEVVHAQADPSRSSARPERGDRLVPGLLGHPGGGRHGHHRGRRGHAREAERALVRGGELRRSQDVDLGASLHGHRGDDGHERQGSSACWNHFRHDHRLVRVLGSRSHEQRAALPLRFL
mmetsp:Transcript_5724/g.17317  ORF Transcript_5724/g.17317 Transcript_5724/m.17317 type:complete len:234 (+) Transcript_5724:78-779(+)